MCFNKTICKHELTLITEQSAPSLHAATLERTFARAVLTAGVAANFTFH
jgi:hypothetical protein